MPEFVVGDDVIPLDTKPGQPPRWARVVEPTPQDLLAKKVRVLWGDTGTTEAVDRDSLALGTGQGRDATIDHGTELHLEFDMDNYKFVIAVDNDGGLTLFHGERTTTQQIAFMLGPIQALIAAGD